MVARAPYDIEAITGRRPQPLRQIVVRGFRATLSSLRVGLLPRQPVLSKKKPTLRGVPRRATGEDADVSPGMTQIFNPYCRSQSVRTCTRNIRPSLYGMSIVVSQQGPFKVTSPSSSATVSQRPSEAMP